MTKAKAKQSKAKNRVAFMGLAVLSFALFAVLGISSITGNQQDVGVGTSLASTQEPADINNDNVVDIVDLSILLSNWNTPDNLSDINNDNVVDIVDLSILLSKWGAVDVGRALVIKHGWDMPTPSYIQNNVARVDSVPVDGVVINMPNISSKVRSQDPISYEQFRQVLGPLENIPLNSVVHNFAMTYSAPSGDYFDDWSVPISNFANLARAAKDVGLEGIVYDNEEYFGRTADWPENCPNNTLIECQNQVRLRGKQIMDAMRTEWPNVRVLAFHGPWVSEPKTANVISATTTYWDISWANELMGPFIIGMLESAANTPSKVIDGGEIYTLRSDSQFAAVRSWQKEGMAANSSLIPISLKPIYADTVSNSFGIYDKPWEGLPMDPAVWQTTIQNAKANADDYVWLYTEQHDWWGSGWPSTPVPSEWINATRTAVEATQ